MTHPLHAQDVDAYGAGFGVLEGDGALRLVGELDLATVGALKDALEPYVRRWGALFMDLSELSFIDSMGMQLLTEVANRRRTGPVVLTGAPKRFRRLFDLVGLEQVPNLKIGWAPA
jgi:anti-anti-sigma factor